MSPLRAQRVNAQPQVWKQKGWMPPWLFFFSRVLLKEVIESDPEKIINLALVASL